MRQSRAILVEYVQENAGGFVQSDKHFEKKQTL